jgi:hypothetical protein
MNVVSIKQYTEKISKSIYSLKNLDSDYYEVQLKLVQSEYFNFEPSYLAYAMPSYPVICG